MTDVPENQKKQYIVMVDEVGMALMAQMCPRMSFCPVEGMPLDNNPNYQVLVSPLSPKAQEVLEEVSKQPIEPPIE